MKSPLLILSIIALVVIAATGTASASPAAATLDISNLASAFSINADQENRLNALYAAMLDNGLTDFQSKLMLSQILHESGLLTDVANYHLMNQNNYAGLKTVAGNYAAYNTVDDFMTAYIGFLTKGSNPLGATSLADFNNRLQQNHYYTANPTDYYNDLNAYFNLLS